MKSASIIGEYVEFIYCGCGCGKTRSKYDNRKRETKYINGHNRRGETVSDKIRKKLSDSHKGKKLSEKTRKLLSELNKGERNYNWSGDKPSYRALHKRIRKILPKPILCIICNIVEPTQISNKSGKYSLELSDWQWLCSKCHIWYDDIPRKRKQRLEEKKKKEVYQTTSESP